MRSGTQVLISTSFVGLLSVVFRPWIRYQVQLWGLQYPGVEFPPDYDQQLLQLLTTSLTAGVGASHMLILKLIEWAPAIAASWNSRREVLQPPSVPSILRPDDSDPK